MRCIALGNHWLDEHGDLMRLDMGLRHFQCCSAQIIQLT